MKVRQTPERRRSHALKCPGVDRIRIEMLGPARPLSEIDVLEDAP